MKLPLLLAAVVALSAASPALAQYRPAPAATPAPTAPPAPVPSPAPAAAPAAAPAPAASASAAASTYSPPACTAPEYPGKSGTDAQILAFNSSFKTYGDCIRKYVDDARAASNAAIDAGNQAVLEYNKYADDVRKQIAADKAK